jgi:uncharacterized repeat protein (TIGR03847 family)
MTRFELDLKPVDHLTADAIGAPGQRVFYVQGWQNARPQPITIIVEKIQLLSLAIGVEKLMADLAREHPELDPAEADFDPQLMRISPPVDPLFRAGEVGLGYDEDSDQVILLCKEIVLEESPEEDASAEASEVRFWCSRSQARRMARWSQEVVNRGRPICPQCGQPMEPEGHFCPKKNGHKH